MFNARKRIREFNLAFGRPVNTELAALTIEDRELLGKLLFEEVVEYCTKGLGLLIVGMDGAVAGRDDEGGMYNFMTLELDEGQMVDPVECADGLGDVNVVIHFAAHWQGFNLDRVTDAVDESNMSKLDEEGKPIINRCRYWNDPHAEDDGHTKPHCRNQLRKIAAGDIDGQCEDSTHLIDPTRPVGKILKGPNFRPPTEAIKAILLDGNH